MRSLRVTCVYFNREFPHAIAEDLLIPFIGLHVIELKICGCSPAAQQLVSRGLFPCAPLAPSLAVDIALLQFTQALFVRLPPNTTSFCETLEYFLEARGYKLTTRVSVIRSDECMLMTCTQGHLTTALRQLPAVVFKPDKCCRPTYSRSP